MAELEEQASIIPAPSTGLGQVVQGDMGRYSLRVSEYSPSGKKEEFAVVVPDNPTWGSIMLRAAILKRTTWKNIELPMIILGVKYADDMGLNILAGDVYMAQEGRLSTTAGAKIRHAMGTGKIAGYTVDIVDGPVTKFEYREKNENKSISLPNYKATITVKVKDWDMPMVYSTTLSEWFAGHNPNWRTRPTYMLRKNALSKALEEVAPMGVEGDEAPPLPLYHDPSQKLAQMQVQLGMAAAQMAGGIAPKGLLGGE